MRIVAAVGFAGLTVTLPTLQDLGALLEPIRAQERLPSLAAAVVRGGRVVAQGAVGVRRAGGNERLTIDDKFHLGSDTKAMTATLIAVLVEERRLSWSTTVGEVFGEGMAMMDPAWRPVTIELLLRHRGGAPATLDRDAAEPLHRLFTERNLTPIQQRIQVVEAVLTRAPIAAPGTRYTYSNLGYVIAGAIAERITGRPYDSLMREKVFLPLGITSAGFGPPGNETQVDQPWGHGADGIPIAPGSVEADNRAYYDPSGRAHMTLGDWAKFVSAHLRGDPRNPAREAILLKSETYEMLHRPVGQYAMGWFTPSTLDNRRSGLAYEGPVLEHNGSNTRWFASVWIFPELNLAVLAATNQGGSQVDHGDGVHRADAHATRGAAAKLLEKFK